MLTLKGSRITACAPPVCCRPHWGSSSNPAPTDKLRGKIRARKAVGHTRLVGIWHIVKRRRTTTLTPPAAA